MGRIAGPKESTDGLPDRQVAGGEPAKQLQKQPGKDEDDTDQGKNAGNEIKSGAKVFQVPEDESGEKESGQCPGKPFSPKMPPDDLFVPEKRGWLEMFEVQ